MAYKSWSIAELDVVIQGYQNGKSAETIATELTDRSANSVLNQARCMCLVERRGPALEEIRARSSALAQDKKFKAAMVRARKTEHVKVGVNTEPGTNGAVPVRVHVPGVVRTASSLA